MIVIFEFKDTITQSKNNEGFYDEHNIRLPLHLAWVHNEQSTTVWFVESVKTEESKTFETWIEPNHETIRTKTVKTELLKNIQIVKPLNR